MYILQQSFYFLDNMKTQGKCYSSINAKLNIHGVRVMTYMK